MEPDARRADARIAAAAEAGQWRDVAIAEAGPFGADQQLVVERRAGDAQALLEADQALQFGHEPRRDAGRALDPLAVDAAPEQCDDAPERESEGARKRRSSAALSSRRS